MISASQELSQELSQEWDVDVPMVDYHGSRAVPTGGALNETDGDEFETILSITRELRQHPLLESRDEFEITRELRQQERKRHSEQITARLQVKLGPTPYLLLT